jgi:hypothetical protein
MNEKGRGAGFDYLYLTMNFSGLAGIDRIEPSIPKAETLLQLDIPDRKPSGHRLLWNDPGGGGCLWC